MAKNDLAGADVRQHRRTLRHAFVAGIALVLLTLASIATSALALGAVADARRSAARARTEQHDADVQKALALVAGERATKANTLAQQRRKEADQERSLACALDPRGLRQKKHNVGTIAHIRHYLLSRSTSSLRCVSRLVALRDG